MKVLSGTILSVLVLSGVPFFAHAAGLYDVSIGTEDVTFSPNIPLVEQSNKIYLTIQNDGLRDVEGGVSFFDGDTLIGSKPFSVRASARPEEVWITWRPTVLGEHRLRVSIENEDAFTDAHPENNQVTLSVLVDRDSDGDSVPDSQDQDRDNDGVLNVNERAAGTDPDRKDTDGDGVDDLHDVYPLDPKRSIREVPRPATPTTTRAEVPPSRVKTPVSTPIARQATTSSTTSVSSSSSISVDTATSSSSTVPVTPTTLSIDESSTTETGMISESIQPVAQEDSPVSRVLMVAAAITGILALGFVWLSYRRD